MQKGFTLIELMIVVAIIGILAGVAVPQYKDYTVKAKVSAAVQAVGAIQTAVVEKAQAEGIALGGTNTIITAKDQWGELGQAQLKSAQISASSIATTGAITLTLANIGSGVDTGTITFTPNVANGMVNWEITADTKVTNTAVTAYLKSIDPNKNLTSNLT